MYITYVQGKPQRKKFKGEKISKRNIVKLHFKLHTREIKLPIRKKKEGRKEEIKIGGTT